MKRLALMDVHMRRFLYYFPGLPGINLGMLADRGLSDRFVGHGGVPLEHGVTGVTRGPAGSGCIVSIGSNPPQYIPEKQEWMNCGSYWVGIEDNALPPGPDDLVRDIGIGGPFLTLGDNKEWCVPLLWKWDRRTYGFIHNLPKAVAPQFNAAGKCTMEVKVLREYRHLEDLAERTLASFMKSEALTYDKAFGDAATLVAVNYRVNTPELGLLGLVNESLIFKILATAIDLAELQSHAAILKADGVRAFDPAGEGS